MTPDEETALAREIRQLVDRLNNLTRKATQQRLHVKFVTRTEPDILFPVTLLDVKILKEL